MSSTKVLVKYLAHLKGKGGDHARLASDVNDKMRGETLLGVVSALKKRSGDPVTITGAQLTDIKKAVKDPWPASSYKGVSKKQYDHVNDKYLDKTRDDFEYGDWAAAGAPNKKELLEARKFFDDEFADAVAAYKTAPDEEIKSKLFKKSLDIASDESRLITPLEKFLKRRKFDT
jgi:hypothetical protein